jgi:hypothetical protein
MVSHGSITGFAAAASAPCIRTSHPSHSLPVEVQTTIVMPVPFGSLPEEPWAQAARVLLLLPGVLTRRLRCAVLDSTHDDELPKKFTDFIREYT